MPPLACRPGQREDLLGSEGVGRLGVGLAALLGAAHRVRGESERVRPTRVLEHVHDEADITAGEWLAVVGDIHLGNSPLMQGVFGTATPTRPPFCASSTTRSEAASRSWSRHSLPEWASTPAQHRYSPTTRSGSPRCPTPAPRAHSQPGSRTSSWSTAPTSSTPPAPSGCRYSRCSGCQSTSPPPERRPATRTRPRAATCDRTYRARARGMERPRSRRPDARARHRRVRARPRHPSPGVRQVTARTQTDVPRHPQPRARSDPLPPRRHAAAESTQHRIRFTEMLPTPEQTWLSDADDNRYVSELRLVALDTRASDLPATQHPIEDNDSSLETRRTHRR